MRVKGEVDGFESYLRIFAESMGVHLLLKGTDGRILTGPVGLKGICAWMCQRRYSPCRETCLEPLSGIHGNDVVRFRHCSLGLIVFSSPVMHRGRLAGYLMGGGALPREGYRPDAERLRNIRLKDADPSTVASMTFQNSFRSIDELSSLIGGVKRSLQVFASTLKIKDTAERRIRQVESLFACMESTYPGLPLKEGMDIILNSLSIFFRFGAALVAVPRPLVQGYYFLSVTGPPSLLPGDAGGNAGDGFPAVLREEDQPCFIQNTSLLMDAGFPEGVRSGWFFPVLLGDSREGIMAILNPSLAREEIRILRGYARFLAQTMRIFNLERSEESLLDEREFLLSLIRELTGISDRDSIYDIFLSKACSITGAEKGSLMLMDEDGELSVAKTLGQDEVILHGFKIKPGEGIAGRAFLKGSAIWTQDLEKDAERLGRLRPRYKTGSFISFPLYPKASPPGVLNLSDKRSGHPFTRQDLDRVRALSDHALMAIERAFLHEKVRIVSSQAAIDDLTGLATRKHLRTFLEAEIARCERHGRSMALIMADVDRFKEYNDLNGHLAGDEALKLIAAILRQSVRTMDMACRFGGEEFCLVLTEAGLDEAVRIAERIRAEVETTHFPGEDGMESGNLTLSLGVASFPGSSVTPEEFLHTADIAMYAAKREGRNRVRWALGGCKKLLRDHISEANRRRDRVSLT
ncbi:MAG: diguanylate cyclase [bacterium]|nr:MAG: diguanylate cyclase [bacterium]